MLDLMNHCAGFEDKYYAEGYSKEFLLSESLEEAMLSAMPDQVYKPGTVQSTEHLWIWLD